MKDIIKTIWQLPQILVGIIVLIFYSGRIHSVYKTKDNIIVARVDNFKGGVCFGTIILINTLSSDKTIQHELGHSKQSQYLGPLYLLVIGLPSLIHNLIYKLYGRRWNYYSFYTEKWANKLMNLEIN